MAKKYSEYMKVKCIAEFSKGKVTFRCGEEYSGTMVNKDWYCVDAVGVSREDFEKCFIQTSLVG